VSHNANRGSTKFLRQALSSELNTKYHNYTKGNEMTTQVVTKGTVLVAQVQKLPMSLYGVNTDWLVRLYFSSPTGDSSDTLTFDLPCLSFRQACVIADHYNAVSAPAFVGHFAEMMMNEGEI
jgi:hypothetical protein